MSREAPDRWHALDDAIGASNLPPSDRAVFRHLLSRADYATAELPKKFTPTQAKVAKATGHSRRQVQYALDHLARHGWVGKTGHTNRVRYTLDHGRNCECTGRVHVPATSATEPATSATVAQELAQPTSATAQVKPPSALEALRGEGRGEPKLPPETDHRYDPISGQFACRRCGRKWSSHEYRPAMVGAA